MSKICLMCGETFPDSTTFCSHDGSALRAAVQGDDLIGESFCDRYVVTDLLGEGGMGSVYLARDVRLPQQVAIKVLRERSNLDTTVVSRFRQEAEAASRINHDCVARVSDFGFRTDGRAFIIMEYVAGRTLRQRLDTQGALSIPETVKITRMVAEGLDAAHRLGIVHRDLKPDNIMIVEDAGGGMRVKVLDFGIAKFLQETDDGGRTAPGFVIGTPQWMSPEQIRGDKLDARSDVFALGLLTYAMLTGQRPYEGASEQTEMLARLTTEPRALAEVMPDVRWPEALQTLISRTLSRDVNSRPNTAVAFARELAEVSNSETVKIPVRITPRKFPLFPVAGGAALLLAFAVIVFLKSQGDTTPMNPASTASVDSVAPVTTQRPDTQPVPTVASGIASTDTTKRGSVPQAATNLTPPPAPAPVVTRAPSRPKDAAKPTTQGDDSRGKIQSGTPAAPATVEPVNTTSAHDELQKIMQDADDDIGKNIDASTKRANARTLIRQLELLAPRLAKATDQAWAQFYVGTSHATLGDNIKACAALGRANALGSESPTVLNESTSWRQKLRCQ